MEMLLGLEVVMGGHQVVTQTGIRVNLTTVAGLKTNIMFTLVKVASGTMFRVIEEEPTLFATKM